MKQFETQHQCKHCGSGHHRPVAARRAARARAVERRSPCTSGAWPRSPWRPDRRWRGSAAWPRPPKTASALSSSELDAEVSPLTAMTSSGSSRPPGCRPAPGTSCSPLAGGWTRAASTSPAGSTPASSACRSSPAGQSATYSATSTARGRQLVVRTRIKGRRTCYAVDWPGPRGTRETGSRGGRKLGTQSHPR